MSRRRRPTAVAAVVAVLALAAACGDGDGDDADGGPVTVTLVTHDSFAVDDAVLAAFTEATGIEVRLLQGGDTGQVVNQAILTKDRPQGDVLFGVDTTFLSRALDEGLFEPYEPAALADVPDRFELDPEHRVTPIDHGEVCLNYDVAWFEERGVPVPSGLGDLTEDPYRDLLVVQNPATSSPGLAFVLATVAEFGEDGWLRYWEELRDNGVLVTDSWEEAFGSEFSAGGGRGERPVVVSYASSPPAAVHFADPRPTTSPIGVVTESCFEQVEFAGVLAGTDHPAEARAVVDLLLSEEFQEGVPLGMFVFPVRDDVRLPDVFTRFAEVPDDPLSLPVEEIGAGRERWIDAWTATVLR